MLCFVQTFLIQAYAFASTFRLKDLTRFFKNAEVQIHKDALVAQFPKASGRIAVAVAFDFGALVFIDVDAASQKELVAALVTDQSQEPHGPLTEDFLLEVDPNASMEVRFDRVVTPDASLPVLKIVSLLLAQSAAMDYYEKDIQDILQRTNHITRSLQTTGRIPGRVRELTKFIGTCIATKNDILTMLALFDKPESTWEVAQLDTLYNALREELEIQDRFRVLEAKLRMIQENLVLLVNFSQQRSTWRLEWAVVLLVLIEVVLSLWQIGYGH